MLKYKTKGLALSACSVIMITWSFSFSPAFDRICDCVDMKMIKSNCIWNWSSISYEIVVGIVKQN